MNRDELIFQIKSKRSFLCIGLDSDIQKIPNHLLKLEDPLFEFNKQIIDATKDLCVAYKPNIAFYEYLGESGWRSLKKTIDYIPKEIFTIADAKRGDIGNTSNIYARTFFENMSFDSVTVSPYMGADSVIPFLEFKDKWAIILALTSNKGSFNFQRIEAKGGKFFFEHIIKISKDWGTDQNLMYVVGATRVSTLNHIRKIIPDHFLLIPGIGAQGGDLDVVCKYAMNTSGGLIINSARNIIYANSTVDFAHHAGLAAAQLQAQMAAAMIKYEKW